MLHTAIGISIILGFLFSEFLGIFTGGLVSAGYLAFYMEQPLRLVSTLVLAIIIYLITKGLQKFMIIYGRRRFMVVVLLSLIGTWLVEMKLYYYLSFVEQDIRVVGFIIPGLIANDMFKQGVVRTILAVSILTIVIKLILMLGLL